MKPLVVYIFTVIVITHSPGIARRPDSPPVAIDSSTCISIENGGYYTIPADLYDAMDQFRFCLKIDSVDAGSAPVRVILALDNTISMCQNPGPGVRNCCVEGDSSGNCMNNDPDDMRVEAAHVFVDSLRAINPQSEVGVVVFFTQAGANGPLSLSSDENVQRIHLWIDDAMCNSDWQKSYSGNPANNIGLGLQSALSRVDENYDLLLPLIMRHIILLTDGSWDDLAGRPPDGLFNTYTTGYPGRTLPVVHGVLLFDSASHVEHGYPPEGCGGSGLVDPSHLVYTAESTGGLYFPCSRPEKVIEYFLTLLDSIVDQSGVPVDIAITNLTTDTRSTATGYRLISQPENQVEFVVDRLVLTAGDNIVVISYTIDQTYSDTITILKSASNSIATLVENRKYPLHDFLKILSPSDNGLIRFPPEWSVTPVTITLYTPSGRVAAEKTFDHLPSPVSVEELGDRKQFGNGIFVLRLKRKNF